MLRLSNVSKRYPPNHEALKDVSFHLRRGEIVFLTGPSGSGKSTLIKLIALMDRPSSGQIVVNGRNLSLVKRRAIPQMRQEMGIIFQNHRLLANRSVFDNVALPLVIRGFIDRQEIARRVRASLDKVGLLGKEKALPETLSGGEQQRVGIARAIVHRPSLLLADEPTGNLDPKLSQEVMELFGEFNRLGISVIIATHDLALIARFPYRILTLDRGHLLY